MSDTTDDVADPGLLYGVPAIAEFLKVRARVANHMIRSGGMPAFKIAGKVCARRGTLVAWLAEREAEGNPTRKWTRAKP